MVADTVFFLKFFNSFIQIQFCGLWTYLDAYALTEKTKRSATARHNKQ
jgi:hypothetical protein